MRPSSTAASVGLGVLLLVAWLASALSMPDAPQAPPRDPAPSSSAHLSELRAGVQMQAERLRERLASAPAPGAATRNPFRFAPRPAPRHTIRAAAVLEPDAAPSDIADAAPPEPVLMLIGVAERRHDDGVVRTAIISRGADDLHLVTTGEEFAGGYRVRAVGAAEVELERVSTGEIVRLRLQ